MRVLIDECAPKALKTELEAGGYDCMTVQDAGWSGKENGELLALADAQYDCQNCQGLPKTAKSVRR